MYVDPNSPAAQQVAAWSTTAPADAAEIQKIASQPQAKWMSGNSSTLVAGDVQFLAARQADGKVPLIVLYNIYERDYSGGYATGGAPSAAAYQSWIDSFVTAVGAARVIAVLEPDALDQITNLPAADQQTRYTLLNYAVTKLKSRANIAVYLDAGNPGWVSAANMAPRLQQAGVANADGFSLNVSNFCYTSQNLTYGDSLSGLLGGGKHFIVDTSRNGLGPDPNGVWCNPSGRALGPQFTTATGDTLCDAYMFVKNPGFSDGACNGGPSWGWWASYALGLCQRAAY